MTYATRRPSGDRSAKAYGDIALETEVFNATPERLITLLYQGARNATCQARRYLAQGKVAERGQAISKAIKIINEGLKISIDKETGGELVAKLFAVYDHLVFTLLQANLKADDQLLEHADSLIASLAKAWQTVVDSKSAGPVR
jgi:flagellar protein FliS